MKKRFEKEEVKQAARGQWKSILASVCGLSANQLDGKHHPCPKCGGNDRFRMIKEPVGSLMCNQCFSTKNGDGIAAIMWMNDCDFTEAVSLTANWLGIEPIKKKSKNRKVDPAEKLKFVAWNDLLAGIWCLQKKPITVDALKKASAQMAIYRDEHKVIAIPVWSKTPANVVGWNLYNVTGGTLPKWNAATKSEEQVKVKLTFGSSSGLMGFIDPESATLYKTEGPTDMLAALSLDHSECSIICNANGAKENPANKFGWLAAEIEKTKISQVRVVHDCDQPGQEGATIVGDDRPGWAPWFANELSDAVVKNLVLPYSIEKTHGKDFRDWIIEGNTLADLGPIDEDTEPTEAMASNGSEIWEADDDPHRLAKVNLDIYRKIYGGKLAFWCSSWWKYKSGQYKPIEMGELKAKINLLIRKDFERIWKEQESPEDPVRKVTSALVRNVIDAMASLCTIPSSIQMPSWLPDRRRRNYVSCKNGILDLDGLMAGDIDDCFYDHSSDWFSQIKLEYQWDKDSDCPIWRKYILSTMEGDEERIKLLQEWAGYLLTPDNPYQKFLVLEGEGKNGKSAFFAGITAMLGQDNVSNVAMESFGGNFSLGTTLGKSANISGDVGEIDNMAEGILKQFTGGDLMQFDRKNKEPISARPTAKLMAAWNRRPRIKDRSDGLWRRLLLIPFRYKVPENLRVHGMDKPEFWTGEAAGILNWAIVGLSRLRRQGRFTDCQISKDVIDEYRVDSNPALEFFDDRLQHDQDGQIGAKELFQKYKEWCSMMNYRPLGQRQFGKELNSKFPLLSRKRIRLGGQREYMYQKISWATEEIFTGDSEGADLW